jgi:hypothetical protein
MVVNFLSGMKRLVPLLSCALLALALGCSSSPELEKKAFSRIPKVLERTMLEEMQLSGGADVVSPIVLYSCDSLCIIQFKAVARNPEAQGYSFPARYFLVKDMMFSRAYGYPVYSEKMTGCPDLNEKEIQETKAKFEKEAEQTYIYYSSTCKLIAPEDL